MNPPSGSESRGVHWVKPKLVAEVAFAEWTNEGQLRQASFQGLREDKDARSVVHERPDPSRFPRKSRPSRCSSVSTPKRGSQSTLDFKLSYIERTNGGRRSDPQPSRSSVVSRAERHQISAGAILRRRSATWILPHVKDRPLTLVRCPEGYKKECFYQKHANDRIPEAVGRVEIPEDGGISLLHGRRFTRGVGGVGSNGRPGAAYLGGEAR